MPSGYKEEIELVRKYKLPLCNSAFLKTKKDADSLRLKFPIVAKIVSSDIIHKTDAGFVRKNIHGKEELNQVFDEFGVKAKRLKARLEGVLVQETVTGLELFVGAKHDAQFGSIVMFGLGGIFLEIFQDISIRIVPLTKEDAVQMITDIKASKIFQGARGQNYALNELAELILKASKIIEKESAIQELDFNPVFLNETGVKLVDIRIIKAK